MATYSKYNIVYRLQKWMDSVPGQTFLNYAYSWGAAIVILGTLFKLTHLPGANFFLFLGMGTEVFVFFISAFDRPFDKQADGLELTKGKYNKKNEVETFIVDDENIEQTGQHQENLHRQYAERLQQAQQLSEKLPDTEETVEMRKTLNAIEEIYKLQLEKASSQLVAIDGIDHQLKTLATTLNELNKVYHRMVEAVNIKENV